MNLHNNSPILRNVHGRRAEIVFKGEDSAALLLVDVLKKDRAGAEMVLNRLIFEILAVDIFHRRADI